MWFFKAYRPNLGLFGRAQTSASAPSRKCKLTQKAVPHVFQLERPDLYEITVVQLQQLYSSGSLTSVEYVEINPYLEAIIEVNPDAIKIAARLDEERIRGKIRGALHGVPVLVKDNIATKDKMQTTAGSWALLGSIVPQDAYVVTQLRNAGAVILGHTNMSEWASVRSKDYSEGYSPRGGQVRNPFDLSRTPYSSIVGPAQINSVVGIKPTPGLTSRNGVIPISYTMDTVGSFGRTVADAVSGFDVIVGQDDRDALTCDPQRGKKENYSQYIRSRGVLKGAKFGLPRKRCWDLVDEDQKTVALKVLDAMKEAGATIIDTDFPCAEDRIPNDGEWDWLVFGNSPLLEST
ncbi:MAG: hypothetical protein Q9218_003501 [Villophora microphyllina]